MQCASTRACYRLHVIRDARAEGAVACAGLCPGYSRGEGEDADGPIARSRRAHTPSCHAGGRQRGAGGGLDSRAPGGAAGDVAAALGSQGVAGARNGQREACMPCCTVCIQPRGASAAGPPLLPPTATATTGSICRCVVVPRQHQSYVHHSSRSHVFNGCCMACLHHPCPSSSMTQDVLEAPRLAGVGESE